LCLPCLSSCANKPILPVSRVEVPDDVQEALDGHDQRRGRDDPRYRVLPSGQVPAPSVPLDTPGAGIGRSPPQHKPPTLPAHEAASLTGWLGCRAFSLVLVLSPCYPPIAWGLRQRRCSRTASVHCNPAR